MYVDFFYCQCCYKNAGAHNVVSLATEAKMSCKRASAVSVMVCAFLAIPQVAPAQVTAVSLGKPSGTVTLYDVSGGNTSDARNASIFKNFSALANVAVQSDFNSDGSKFFAAEQN